MCECPLRQRVLLLLYTPLPPRSASTRASCSRAPGAHTSRPPRTRVPHCPRRASHTAIPLHTLYPVSFVRARARAPARSHASPPRHPRVSSASHACARSPHFTPASLPRWHAGAHRPHFFCVALAVACCSSRPRLSTSVGACHIWNWMSCVQSPLRSSHP